MRYYGRVEKGMVMLDDPLPLAAGTAVTIYPANLDSTAAEPATAVLINLFPPEDLAEIEASLRDCRTIDTDGR